MHSYSHLLMLFLVISLVCFIGASEDCYVGNLTEVCYVDASGSECYIEGMERPSRPAKVSLPRNTLPDSVSISEGKLYFRVNNVFRFDSYYIVHDVFDPQCRVGDLYIDYRLCKSCYLVDEIDLPASDILRDKHRLSLHMTNVTATSDVVFGFITLKGLIWNRILWIFPAILVLIFLIIRTQFNKYKGKNKGIIDIKRIASMFSDLQQDHMDIIKIIAENNGITQRELRERLNWSPAKISRLLQELEDLGIVERGYYGRTRRVFISSYFFREHN